MNTDLLRNTENFLHDQIPLTKAMGVTVASYDDQRLILSAPLEPNHNHLGTAFGGSLSALATLAAYAMLWLELSDRRAHVVIRDSTIRYRRPVRGALRAVCHRPAGADWSSFLERFNAAGKAHLALTVQIVEAEEICADFAGVFVTTR